MIVVPAGTYVLNTQLGGLTVNRGSARHVPRGRRELDGDRPADRRLVPAAGDQRRRAGRDLGPHAARRHRHQRHRRQPRHRRWRERHARPRPRRRRARAAGRWHRDRGRSGRHDADDPPEPDRRQQRAGLDRGRGGRRALRRRLDRRHRGHRDGLDVLQQPGRQRRRRRGHQQLRLATRVPRRDVRGQLRRGRSRRAPGSAASTPTAPGRPSRARSSRATRRP